MAERSCYEYGVEFFSVFTGSSSFKNTGIKTLGADTQMSAPYVYRFFIPTSQKGKML
jgi:hypothetical protein